MAIGDMIEVTPGPTGTNPYELVVWAFESAWQVAQQKSETSDALFNSALTAGGNAPAVNAAPFAFSPNVIEPPVNIPMNAEGASIARFYEMSTAIINQLSDEFAGFINLYLPNECDYLGKAQQWICDTLTYGGTGINPHVEAQIWERDRSRILRDSARLTDDAMQQWAAKGFTMPPGALAYQVHGINRDAGDKIAQASRERAIQQAQIEIENVRFAVDKAIDLYMKALAAAADFIKAIAIGPQAGMQLIPSVTDSQARLITAAKGYYDSRISVEELRLKASLPPAEWEQRSREKTAELIMEEIKTRVQAAVEAARSMGTQAASALNALHASTSTSGSSGTSVGYQYGGDVNTDVPPITSI